MSPDPSASAPKPDLTITEDGYALVVIGACEARIDLYRAYNQLIDFDAQTREEHPDEKAAARRQGAYLDRVCGLLADLGFGAVSHRAADKFDAQITKAVAELGKAEGTVPTPASPASTVPTS